MSIIEKRLGALEQRMQPSYVHQVRLIDRHAADYSAEQEARWYAESEADPPKPGEIRFVIVETPCECKRPRKASAES